MSKYSRDDILASVRDHGIRFIRLQFTDIFGVLKNVNIPASQLEKAMDGEIIPGRFFLGVTKKAAWLV